MKASRTRALPLVAVASFALLLASCGREEGRDPGASAEGGDAATEKSAAADEREVPLSDAALAAELREGGLLVTFRHAASTVLEACDVHEKAEWDAKQIREAFRRRGIPVGAVHTMPYCRPVDGPPLSFDRATARRPVVDARVLAKHRAVEGLESELHRILAVESEGNVVLLTHHMDFEPHDPPEPTEGEVGVFRRVGDERFLLLRRFSPAEWATFSAND